MKHMAQYAWLIPLLPLLAFVIISFLTSKAKTLSALVALASVGTSFIISVIILWQTILEPKTTELALDWLNLSWMGPIKGLNVQMGLLIDPLGAMMLFVVTLVATLVTLYSMGYMHGDEGYSRYFSYIALFTFSMLGLVISNNYFQMFVFWELVGLCSYLLIGFWFHLPSAADASKKAFITNRWADFGFMTGVILLFAHFGTFNFGKLANLIGGAGPSEAAFLTMAGLLVFMGPLGKSAQFPLHVWLPDAMEGPTPVSALIHAATMVAAGVFLLARGFILFEHSEIVMEVIAYVGGFTALFAASIALVQKDIKRILAFSTLSQLGYMVMVMGLGSLTAGMFHLTTHAFFKALLFLGAGSVIHAVHDQDIFNMGGLSKKMPITTWTFIIGSLALAGIFPLAGFWSKDEILLVASHTNTGLYILASVVAFMTAFYMFRLIFVAFFGEKRSDHHAHESSWVMTLPLVILAVFAVFAGLTNSPWFYETFGKSFGTFIFFGDEAEAPQINMMVAGASTILALSGIFVAWLVYFKKLVNTEKLAVKYSGVYNLLYNKYYIDNVYDWFFDNVMLLIGRIFDWIDHYIVDGIFDGFAGLMRALGNRLRFTQTGSLQNYALVMFAAVVIIVIFMNTPVLGGVIR